jgi:DNA helicase-2/ATP-dependent DNA helicase PcrA
MPHLRSNQADILNYTHGRMGIAAVPGSGKTWTLSLLGAEIIQRGLLSEDQEVLVVTLVNSAVDNFYQRLSSFVQGRGLLPNLGYRVRTLHGLAYDILRERPALAGLADDFQIVDEREAQEVRGRAVRAWLEAHPYELDGYLNPELDESRRDWARREFLPNLLEEIALSFIRSAKDQQLTPQDLRARLDARHDALALPLPLAEMGCAIYADYQHSLAYRGGVDFDDLIRLALQALQADHGYLERLRQRWPYILEDEAQDSSQLQELILDLLAGPEGNWVRVGDPNQAIYETFTTASPRYLREFIARYQAESLPHSGRATRSLIDLANYLVDWTQTEHPIAPVRQALKSPPAIEPTGPDDPQPNPPDDPSQVRLVLHRFTPDAEVQAVADSLAGWLPEHPQATVAVLAPRNARAFELVDELRRRKIDYHDGFLRSSSPTRFSAGALGNLLKYLSDPQSSNRLATAYRVWRRADRDDEAAQARLERVAELLRKCRRVEDFLWPVGERDWLEETGLQEQDPEAYEQLLAFRELTRRWQGAVLLPVDQIVLTLAQDLLRQPEELAVAYKLAAWLRRASQVNPAWRLPEWSEELGLIARNERRFLGFDEDDTGFDPDKFRGKVVVATMHKAKGLEWDRVYLMSVNNYDFPSGGPQDPYIAEKWFIREQLNLPAEALAQLQAALAGRGGDAYVEGAETQAARLDYARERLRLLYVGITRARKELVITWNNGRNGDLEPALPLAALHEFWEAKNGI